MTFRHTAVVFWDKEILGGHVNVRIIARREQAVYVSQIPNDDNAPRRVPLADAGVGGRPHVARRMSATPHYARGRPSRSAVAGGRGWGASNAPADPGELDNVGDIKRDAGFIQLYDSLH